MESFKSKLVRWRINLYPCYWGTGARVTYIKSDYSEVHVRLPLNWQTRNIVNVIFGGSLYAAVDPFYMMMLMHRLGDEFIVWDKAASIRFRRPGRETLYGECVVPDSELEAIRTELAPGEKCDRVYATELKDSSGRVCAEISKTVYVRRKGGERTS